MMQHAVVDIYAPAQKLKSTEVVRNFLYNLPDRISMNRLIDPVVVQFDDGNGRKAGVTGFVIIAESHISVHTYPEYNLAHIDVFSCKDYDIDIVLDCIKEHFKNWAFELQRITRTGLSNGKTSNSKSKKRS